MAPKEAPGSDFLANFRAKSVCLTFGSHFSSFFDEKSMKNSMRFFKAISGFFNIAMALIYAQAQCFEHFLLFSFFLKISKNDLKNEAKLVTKENFEK